MVEEKRIARDKKKIKRKRKRRMVGQKKLTKRRRKKRTVIGKEKD